MAVVREFTLPDLGEGLTEAEIVRWLVQVGDVVAVDQPVVEVETAKAMVEVPSPYGGVVTARFGEEGTELPVGAALLTVAVGAESAAGSAAAVEADDGAGTGARAGDAGPDEGSGNVLVGYGTSAPATRRRRVRPGEPGSGSGRLSGPAAGCAGSGGNTAVGGADPGRSPVPGGPGAGPESREAGARRPDGALDRGQEAAVGDRQAGEGAGPVAVVSPLVRRLARENGLDLRQVAGSGPDGLVLRADVERAVRAARVTASSSGEVPYAASGTVGQTGPEMAAPVPGGRVAGAAAPGSGPEFGAGREVRVPLRGIRGVVADKLARSRREIPDATTWVDADATELLAARAAMNAAGGAKVSLLALLARICTAALARHPELNSTVDTEAREIVRLPTVHLGFAAQTARGLVVPVVRDAHTRDAVGLSEEFARLTEAGRAGQLTPAELTGGTFTLNNYGVFGVDGSTPIINHPEAAMLGVGRIAPKPWVHRGELAVRQVVQLSLTFDHRVCDGGTAGGFLRYVADCVEQPAVLLRTL